MKLSENGNHVLLHAQMKMLIYGWMDIPAACTVFPTLSTASNLEMNACSGNKIVLQRE